MTLHTYNFAQGSVDWYNARLGIVTSSVIGKLITPSTLKVANNDTSRGVLHTLVAERVTGHIDEAYVSSEMDRGTLDEPFARAVYNDHIAPVTELGFMVRDDWGHRLGYSPDGLIGDDGLIEIKSRLQKIQLATILNDKVPTANIAQIQCGLLVSGREWCDYVSYCGGMPLYTKRVHPDPAWHDAIVEALHALEDAAADTIADYTTATLGLPTTDRIDHYLEMSL